MKADLNLLLSNIKRNKNVYRNILIALLVSVFVSVMVVSIILYVEYDNILIKEISNAELNRLTQASYSTHFMTEYSITLALQLYFDPTISKVLFPESYSINDYQNVKTRLDKFRVSTPFIHSVYLYNARKKEFVLSTPFEESKIQNESDFFDQDIIKYLYGKNFKENEIYAENTLLVPREIMNGGNTKGSPL